MADDEDQIMDVKLALLGAAIWSNREHRASINIPLDPTDKDSFAVVTLGTERGGGKFFFATHHEFFRTRQEAFDAALKHLAAGEEVNP